MSTVVTGSSQKERILIDEGTHIARCYSFIHLGTAQEMIMGEAKIMNKLRYTFEVPAFMHVFDEKKGEQPLVIDKELTLSLHEKANLRKSLEAWRSKKFTQKEIDNGVILEDYVGKPCMITVAHKQAKNGNTYANVVGITGIPKGFECPAQINPSFIWNFDDHFDTEKLDKFPDFIKNRIKVSEEYDQRMRELHNEEEKKEITGITSDIPEDDLPF